MRNLRRAGSLAAAVLVATVAVLAPVGPSEPGAVRAAGPDPCADGWDHVVESPNLSINDIARLGPSRAISVGTQRRFNSDRSYITSFWTGTEWRTTVGGPTGGDTALMAVGGRLPDRLWAVGFVEDDVSVAMAVHWQQGHWVRRSPPAPSSGAQVLSAVDVDPSGDAWAVGMAVPARIVRTALIWQHTRSGWRRHTPAGVGRGTSLTAVRAIARDDVWAVGSASTAAGIRPLVLHWDGDRWSHNMIDGVGTDATLSGIAGDSGTDLWAVGWTTQDGSTRPLVLHRTGNGWQVEPPPDLGGVYSVLSDVSVDRQGRPWVVGGSYRDASEMYVPVAARLDPTGWTLWPRPPGTGRYLSGVSGDLANGGWATGRGEIGAIRMDGCEPTAPLTASGRRAIRATWGTGTDPLEDAAGERLPQPRRGLPRVPALAEPAAPEGLTVRDVAKQVGIRLDSRTYGATWADLDDDGRKDLFISGHAGPASLYLRVEGGFKRQTQEVFRRVDRHDCDVARIDEGPVADIVCTGGADRGVGFKANELWVDPASGVSDDQGPARGIADPVGRGREIALFDADGDGDQDLLLGTMPLRYDSQPSPNRLMLNDGTGHFTWDRDSGIPRDRGAWCVEPFDLERDGDKDLLLCAVSGNFLESAQLMVLRNQGGRFTDVTRALGIRGMGEHEAQVGNLGGDDHPDIVQLSLRRIRVNVWTGDRYVATFERSIVNGRSVAVGDANGDGRDDIYLQLGTLSRNDPDVVLLNDGTGHSFRTIAVPSTRQGTAQDVIPLDWDKNGLTDFLVLNGGKGPGPTQLISFFR